MILTQAASTVGKREWSRVLGQLRADDFSVIESIKVTRAVVNVSMGEAKHIVHMSSAWADMRRTFETLHDGGEVAATEGASN